MNKYTSNDRALKSVYFNDPKDNIQSNVIIYSAFKFRFDTSDVNFWPKFNCDDVDNKRAFVIAVLYTSRRNRSMIGLLHNALLPPVAFILYKVAQK